MKYLFTIFILILSLPISAQIKYSYVYSFDSLTLSILFDNFILSSINNTAETDLNNIISFPKNDSLKMEIRGSFNAIENKINVRILNKKLHIKAFGKKDALSIIEGNDFILTLKTKLEN